MNSFLYIPISYLYNNNISEYSFMANTSDCKKLLNKIFSQLPTYKRIKYTFRIKNFFVFVLENSSFVYFENKDLFNCFSEYIHNLYLKKYIIIDSLSNSISIKSSCPKIIYIIIIEFTIF